MFVGPPNSPENEVTSKTVDFINEHVLKATTTATDIQKITANDIDRCHPIGAMRGGKQT